MGFGRVGGSCVGRAADNSPDKGQRKTARETGPRMNGIWDPTEIVGIQADYLEGLGAGLVASPGLAGLASECAPPPRV